MAFRGASKKACHPEQAHNEDSAHISLLFLTAIQRDLRTAGPGVFSPGFCIS
jgi:hypothetical protein